MKRFFAVVLVGLLCSFFSLAAQAKASFVPVRGQRHHAQRHHAHRAGRHHTPRHPRHRGV